MVHFCFKLPTWPFDWLCFSFFDCWSAAISSSSSFFSQQKNNFNNGRRRSRSFSFLPTFDVSGYSAGTLHSDRLDIINDRAPPS